MTSAKVPSPRLRNTKLGQDIIGDIEIDPAVVVEVGGDDAEPSAVGPADARRGPVTSVNVRSRCCDRGSAGPGGSIVGRAVDPDLLGRVLARHRPAAEWSSSRDLPVAESGHIEVQVAVLIVVEEGPAVDRSVRRCPPAR